MAKKTSPFDGVTRLYARVEPIRNRKGVIVDYDALPDVIRVEHADGTDYYIRGEGADSTLTRLPGTQTAGAEAEFAGADVAKRERRLGSNVVGEPSAETAATEPTQQAEAPPPDSTGPGEDPPEPKKRAPK